jgi:hypothetical protein
MQNDIQQGAVNLQVAGVVDEAQPAEFIHEEAYPRSRRADHLREHFLVHLGNERLWLSFLAKIRQDKKHPSQTLFARIEQLIDQIRLNSHIARQKASRSNGTVGPAAARQSHHACPGRNRHLISTETQHSAMTFGNMRRNIGRRHATSRVWPRHFGPIRLPRRFSGN